MESHAPESAYNRRRLVDRRAHSTTLWSALHWHGRRTGYRRREEGRHAYVDCPSPYVVLLVVTVLIGSLLDAYFTLCYIAQGGSEANPLMDLALSWGPGAFTGIKMGLTGLGVWFLAAHQQFPLAYTALHGIALIYLLLGGYYAVLFL